jgi:hypothetical protein
MAARRGLWVVAYSPSAKSAEAEWRYAGGALVLALERGQKPRHIERLARGNLGQHDAIGSHAQHGLKILGEHGASGCVDTHPRLLGAIFATGLQELAHLSARLWQVLGRHGILKIENERVRGTRRRFFLLAGAISGDEEP